MPFIKLGESPHRHARARVAPLRAINSSFIIASRALLRELEVYERYVARLEPDVRDALERTPSGVWVPTALARAHLEACEALQLDASVQLDMGRKIALRLHGPVLTLALRLAGAAGATPLLLAEKAVKVWPQRNDGGDLLIVQTAPSEARVELLGYTLADIGHARLVWRGTLEANARLVMRRARVTEVTSSCDATTLVFHMAW